MIHKILDKIDYVTLPERVYKILKEKIIQQNLEAGAKIGEQEIADQLGVSRAPVREAITQLKAEGLVTSFPRKGTFVVDLSSRDIKDLYEVRGVLESLAIRLSISLITDEDIAQLRQIMEKYDAAMSESNYLLCFDLDKEFHTYLVKMSNNRKLIDLMKNLEGNVQITRWINCREEKRKRISTCEHKQIVDALVKRDKELACRLVTEHIERVKKDLC